MKIKITLAATVLAIIGIGLGSPKAFAQTVPEIKPPPTVVVKTPPKSVVLGPGSHSENIKALTVKRQFDVTQLRANPVITLGKSKVNLASVFNNPSALPNVATRLRAMPQLAEVFNDHMQVMEVSQGLILHHFISYRLKPGTCSDPARRSALSSSGVRCSAKMSDEARAAAFSTRGNPHYIADAGQRAIAMADAKKKSAAVLLQVASNLTKLRTSLNSPAERAKIDSLRGAGEAARLSKLSDEQLKSEIINSAVTKIEQVAFVPMADKLYEMKIGPLFLTGVSLKPTIDPLGLLKVTLPAASTTAVATDKALEPQIFLTGFTLGRDYEWSQRIEKTVSWCIVGCDETYYAEVHAGFNYGFGLRFPIKLGGNFHYQPAAGGKKETASVTTDFIPIYGTPDNFAATGLDQSKIFDGKEFVAQFGAHAGASYSLPNVAMALVGLPGTGSFPPENPSCDGTGYSKNDLCIGYDFTEQLSPPFKGGKFTPPAPCPPGPTPCPPGPTMVKIFDDFDLIGGRANFGIIGAQVFPAVQVVLNSDSLKFTLHDNINKVDIPLTSTHMTQSVGVDPSDHSSSFTIGNPVYNLSLDVTPGIDAHAFIDIEVWSDSWDWPIWFPQLTMHLPPGGATFSCHDGTICTRDYKYSPTMSQSSAVAKGFDTDVDNWSKGFDVQWLPQCVDDTCKFGIKFVRLGAVLSAKQQHEANPQLQFSDARVQNDLRGSAAPKITQDADTQARSLTQAAQGRQTSNELEADKNFVLAIWSAKCSDKLCFDNVTAITNHEAVDVSVRSSLSPGESILSVFGKVSKEYGNKQLQAEIDASTARAAAAASRPAIRIVVPH